MLLLCFNCEKLFKTNLLHLIWINYYRNIYIFVFKGRKLNNFSENVTPSTEDKNNYKTS